MLRDRVRTILTALSIALGVSVVVAINLAGGAATGSFQSSVETLSGKSALTISEVGGVEERLLSKLVQLPYPFEFAPRIEDFATPNGHGAALPFIGINLIGAGGGDRSQEQQQNNDGEDFRVAEITRQPIQTIKYRERNDAGKKYRGRATFDGERSGFGAFVANN